MPNTCYQWLTEKASRNGYVVYYGHKLPISLLIRDVDRLAAAFSQFGLQKGDVVTVYLPSCPQGLAAFYACSKLGLVANVVHPKTPLNLLRENLQAVNSKVLMFYDVLVRNEKQLASLNQILVRCSIADYVTVRKGVFKLYSKAISKREKTVLAYEKVVKTLGETQIIGDENDVVCYMHSGGTSGQPKIVKLSNRAFNQTALGMQLMYHPNVDASCYNLATLPIFHAYGLCAAVHAPLIMGVSIILVPQFKPKEVQRYLKKYKVTVWSVVPAMLKKMIKANALDNKRALKDLDVIWCGGDVLDESLVKKVDGILQKHCQRAKLMRGYGLTEVCGVCVVNNYDFYKTGSCGRPMPTAKVQIWDESGNELPSGSLGEVVVCSEGNASGYLDGDDFLVQKGSDVWVLTGDVGYLDQDGYLFIVDRKKRSLKIAAVNVFPAQVENCVKQLEDVDEACAVGVKVKGKPYVKLYLTVKDGADPEKVAAQAVEICKVNLMPYSVPRIVEVLPVMPRTDFGKVDYKALEKHSV